MYIQYTQFCTFNVHKFFIMDIFFTNYKECRVNLYIKYHNLLKMYITLYIQHTKYLKECTKFYVHKFSNNVHNAINSKYIFFKKCTQFGSFNEYNFFKEFT